MYGFKYRFLDVKKGLRRASGTLPPLDGSRKTRLLASLQALYVYPKFNFLISDMRLEGLGDASSLTKFA